MAVHANKLGQQVRVCKGQLCPLDLGSLYAVSMTFQLAMTFCLDQLINQANQANESGSGPGDACAIYHGLCHGALGAMGMKGLAQGLRRPFGAKSEECCITLR